MEILLNTDLVKAIEKEPETAVTLTTGEKICLKTTPGDVLQKIDASRQGIREEERANRRKPDKKPDRKSDRKSDRRPDRGRR